MMNGFFSPYLFVRIISETIFLTRKHKKKKKEEEGEEAGFAPHLRLKSCTNAKIQIIVIPLTAAALNLSRATNGLQIESSP